ncbi:hypothetical protein OAQ99_07915, partial [Candidatus Kapabacteria bacterium]|nr:hypothetical protein [Candidatus Kapabacteria bacterium]
PEYLKVDFEPEQFIEWDMARYIRSANGPNLVMPYHTKEEYKQKKGPKKNILTNSGIYLQQITNDNTAQTETWIAVNPTNPKNIIATANDFSALGGNVARMVANVSLDGGETWIRNATDNHNEEYIILRGNRGATIFDPVITFNSDGLAQYVYGYAITSGESQPNGIFASFSENGGLDWNQWDNSTEVPIVAYSTSGLQDRYHVTVDNTGGQYDGRLYVAWRDFASYNGIKIGYADKENYVSQLWKQTGVFNQTPATQAPFPVVGTDGTVWVSFRRSSSSDQTDAPIYASTNGGDSFINHSVAMNNWNIGLPSSELEEGSNRVVLANKDNMRMSTNPQLAVDHSDGPYRGSLYCVMPGKRDGLDGDNKIYLATLRNATTDSKPDEWEVKTIDNSNNGNDMFFPAITVDPVTGYIHVFYYSSQEDPENKKVDAYYAYSYDGGNTWKHKRLTDESMTVRAINQDGIGNRYWGDYACITAHDNHIYPLFWVQENPNSYASCELYTSKLRTYPDAPENIASEFSNGSLNISWSGIYDGLGEVINDYDVKLFKNGQEIATFEKGQNSYSDSDVSLGNEVRYGLQVISKDVKGAGEICEFVVNIGGNLETKAPENFVAVGTESGLLIRYTSPTESIDGQSIEGITSINVYSDDSLIGTIENQNILSGEIREDFIPLENDVYYSNLTITAVRERDGESAESVRSNSSIGFTGAPIENLSESFEDNTNIIPHFTDGTWNTTTEAASDGNVSFTDSPNENYDPTADSFVIFKPIVVTADNPQIVLDAIVNVRDGDLAYFETSNDFGKTWQLHYLTSSAYFDGWTEDLSTSEWLPLPLNALAEGQSADTVYLRLRLESVKLNSGEGVFVDNIRPDNIAG